MKDSPHLDPDKELSQEEEGRALAPLRDQCTEGGSVTAAGGQPSGEEVQQTVPGSASLEREPSAKEQIEAEGDTPLRDPHS